MQKRKALWLCFTLSAICLAAIPPSETDDAARMIQAALQPSPLESNLRRLTDEVGGRVPGTPAMQRAVDWGVQMFKAAGADSVHTEEFTIPHSWSEGATEMTVSATGTALDPKLTQIPQVGFRVRCVSIAWAPALAPVKHVPVAVRPTSQKPETFPAKSYWSIRSCSRPGTICSPSIRTRRRLSPRP
jgi:hypothetical protein